MTILQQPDVLSLSGNIKEFRIGTAETISFVLRQGNEEIIAQSYEPGADGIVIINVRDIIHARLSFLFRNVSSVYEQSTLVSTFKALISGTEVVFRAIRCGIDAFADTATNFLTQNFLTWQPNLKPVTYYSPEFLTYYATTNCSAKLRAYFTDNTGTTISQRNLELAGFVSGKAYTIPLQYASVAEKLGNEMPAYYDVWVESQQGERLTYIQRYYASDTKSETEQWVLFENSLGGLDTFRAYGSTAFTGEHTHNIAEIDDVSLEYRVDTSRKFQKDTGFLNRKERTWLLDFFPSLKKYLHTGSSLRSIIVIESNVTYTDKELPSNYTFTYKYADAKPLLNLPRTDVPSGALDITVPEVGSFTVPPRLVEFPRLPLSEGALFPVQDPYSEEWNTTTMGELYFYFYNRLVNNLPNNSGALKKTIYVTSSPVGFIKTGDVLPEGTTHEEIFKSMFTRSESASLEGRISTANDVEFGTSKGFLTYTAKRAGNGVMTKAYYDNVESNKLEFSNEVSGLRTAIRQLMGIYTQKETYTATVVFAASEDKIIPEQTLNNTISVNVRRKWFAGVCLTAPVTSSDVRSLNSSGLYTGAGTYKFNTTQWKTVAVCIPEGSVTDISIASSTGNFVENGKVCTGPITISVEGANGSAAINYKMWIVRTEGTNDPDSFTFKTI